jgi:hypothetical protein
MRTKLAAAIFCVCLIAPAQMKMSVEQLASFVKSSIKLGHEDRRVAEYLRKVTLANRLDTETLNELIGLGAGPRTVDVLRNLAEASKDLPPSVSFVPKPQLPQVVVIPPPLKEEIDQVLEQVSAYARDYSKQLPNFICVQRTLRYYDPSGMEFWQRDSTILAQLTYFEQKEDYKIVMVDNRATTGMSFEKLGGATSAGEFGSMLKEIFDPQSHARFQWERWATLRGRRMHVFSYRVAQPYSKWSILYQRTQQVTPGYRGLVYVDRDTTMVMRVTLEAEDIPVSFPVQAASQVLDYDFAKIADQEYLVPIKSVMRMREARLVVKNETEFRLYRKFGADSIIKSVDFDNLPPMPDSGEQPAAATPAPPPPKQ